MTPSRRRFGVYRLDFRKQAGRDRDGLTLRVAVPPGTVPAGWSAVGRVSARTVAFIVTTNLDRTFEVRYGPG